MTDTVSGLCVLLWGLPWGMPVAFCLLRATTGGIQGAKGHSCASTTCQGREGLFIIGVVLRGFGLYIYIYRERDVYIHIERYTCVYIHIILYIYVYILV